MQEHIKIYTGTAMMVNRLAYLLDEQNIHSIIKNEIESGRLAGFVSPENSVELYILNSDLENAKAVFEVFKNEIEGNS
uniref:putative signal transducing protein n=1 Tax=Flavobacterium sp. TaxID=239 RepID=UPI004049D3CC